jgi:pantoate--beta-alanine ligase
MPQKKPLVLLRSIAELRAWRKAQGTLRVGLVPTMGALHEGHLSLIQQSRLACDQTIASIFVNPLQFGPKEDLARYPRPFERDCALLEEAGCDALFAPEPSEMTPPGATTFIIEEAVSAPLCGALRPGHFKGVTTIVFKLFQVVQPQVAFFGQKDAQQVAVIERMVRDLFLPFEIVRGETVREADGLALSSRNAYLTAHEREQAAFLFKVLQTLKERLREGETRVSVLEKEALQSLSEKPEFRVQYLEIRDRTSMERLEVLDRPAVACVAAFLGTTRLIDNVELEP